MRRERNNLYAVTADAVDLAMDTAGAIGAIMGSVAGTMAEAVGLSSSPAKNAEDSFENAVDKTRRTVARAIEPSPKHRAKARRKAAKAHTGGAKTSRKTRRSAA